MTPTPPAPLAPMAEYPQWICWQLVQRPGKPKPDKVPTHPLTRAAINPHDPRNWMSYADTVTAAHAAGLGLGFVFTEVDPFFFLDIDGCVTQDEPPRWSDTANELLSLLPGAAVETSISGRGLHVFGRCPRSFSHSSRNSTINCELYTSNRFVAIGHNQIGDANVDCTAGLTIIRDRYFPPRVEADAGDWTFESRGAKLPDEEVIGRARLAKGGFGFADLWAGNISAYPSPSEADLALASKLAFWCGGNCDQIQRLMRASGLARDKWDSRDDYLPGTILKAVGSCSQFYTGRHDDPSVFGDTPSEIIVTTDDIQMLNAACRVLRDRRPTLFHVGAPGSGTCVQLAETAGTSDVSEAWAEAVLSHEINWKRVKKTKKETVMESCRPPKQLAKLISTGYGDLPQLKGISTLPVLRNDGSVLSTPGYDIETGLYLRCDPDFTWDVGSSLDHARSAVQALLSAVSDAPWANPHDSLCWLAHVLTVGGRYLIDGPTPAWVYSASQPDSGKTTLATAAAWIPTGERIEAVSCAFDATSIARRVGPAANDPGITLDNLHGSVVRSADLESWITSGIVRYELKYANAVVRPLRAVVVLTANSARAGRDLALRSVPVHLSPAANHQFRHGDLLEALGPSRFTLACHVLTILRAWILNGKAAPSTNLPRFASWAGVIGGAIEWATGTDLSRWVIDSQGELDVDDETSSDIVEHFGAWLAARGEDEASARDILEQPSAVGTDISLVAHQAAARARLLSAVASRKNIPPDRIDAGTIGIVFRTATQWTDHGRLASKKVRGKRLWRVERKHG